MCSPSSSPFLGWPGVRSALRGHAARSRSSIASTCSAPSSSTRRSWRAVLAHAGEAEVRHGRCGSVPGSDRCVWCWMGAVIGAPSLRQRRRADAEHCRAPPGHSSHIRPGGRRMTSQMTRRMTRRVGGSRSTPVGPAPAYYRPMVATTDPSTTQVVLDLAGIFVFAISGAPGRRPQGAGRLRRPGPGRYDGTGRRVPARRADRRDAAGRARRTGAT